MGALLMAGCAQRRQGRGKSRFQFSELTLVRKSRGVVRGGPLIFWASSQRPRCRGWVPSGGLSFFGALPVCVGRREQTLLRYLTWSDSLKVAAGWAQDAVDGLCRRGPQLPSGGP